jgi:hypothetical protein
MRTVLFAVIVGCASASAHAEALQPRHDLPSWAIHPSAEAPGLARHTGIPLFVEAEPRTNSAFITPGTIALSLIALGGVVLGKISEQRSGVSTLGPIN